MTLKADNKCVFVSDSDGTCTALGIGYHDKPCPYGGDRDACRSCPITDEKMSLNESELRAIRRARDLLRIMNASFVTESAEVKKSIDELTTIIENNGKVSL